METFKKSLVSKLVLPESASHKGQNGKMMIIGGSRLFHAASLWSLTIASRVVDMVFYASVKENNAIVHELKKEFRNGIVVPRDDIENYIQEAESVVIGPGMMRTSEVNKWKLEDGSLRLGDINAIDDEGVQSYYLTKYLLQKYPEKKWIIDAGALQMMDLSWLGRIGERALLTPHQGEFERVFGKTMSVQEAAKRYGCLVLLKGEEDILCSPTKCISISGGNAGMTKGGTGDVLAGLIGALATKNDLFLAAAAGAFINKKAGEALFQKVGYYFNASDLADEIPKIMKKELVLSRELCEN